MNFGRFDMVLLVSMAMAIILMSFVMPAAGITTSNNTSQDDIPKFNISSSNWDLAGEFPDPPGTPSTATLTWYENGTGRGDINSYWVTGSTNSGHEITLIDNNTDGAGTPDDVAIVNTVWYDGVVQRQTFSSVDSEGQEFSVGLYITTLLGADYNVTTDYLVTTYQNENQSNFTAIVDVAVIDHEQGGSLIRNIPIIGDIFEGADTLAAMFGWFTSIVWWFAMTMWEITLTVIGTMLSVMIFAVDFSVWLSTTYFDIVDAAPGWAAVIVTIPGIIISVIFLKMGMIGVKLLPLT